MVRRAFFLSLATMAVAGSLSGCGIARRCETVALTELPPSPTCRQLRAARIEATRVSARTTALAAEHKTNVVGLVDYYGFGDRRALARAQADAEARLAEVTALEAQMACPAEPIGGA